LRCYYKARFNGLTAKNIKSGWRAGGLWPTNNAKPLLSRLLLENSNNSKDQATKRKAEELLPDWNVDQSLLDVVTPKKLKDVKDQVYQIS
jgi:4-hydroxybenzoate polyprenyltransferase